MARKSFKADMAQQPMNPAATYITTTDVGEPEREFKAKRLNLMIRPSVHERLVKIAAMKRTSVNDLIDKAMEEYADTNAELVRKYNDTFGTEG